MNNVFHVRVGHTDEWATKTPKLTITAYYYTTTLYYDPYSIRIDSWRLSHVRALWPIVPHTPQRFCRPVEPTCRVVSLATSVRSWALTSALWRISSPSYTERLPPCIIRLLRFLSLLFFCSFAACRALTSALSRIAECIITCTPLTRQLIASLIKVGELF